MATMKELCALRDEQREALHKTERRIKRLQELIDSKCKHIKTKISYDGGHYEEGRMSGPSPRYRVVVCCKCGKQLAIEHREETKRWALTQEGKAHPITLPE